MHRLIPYMKKYVPALLLIVALLVAQAMFELWLPTYTAAIVDEGIQQQGISHAAPEVIRQSTLRSLLPLMGDKGAVAEAAYAYLPEQLEKQGLEAADETIFALRPVSKEERAVLDSAFKDAFAAAAVAVAIAAPDAAIDAETAGNAAEQIAIAAVIEEYKALGVDLRAVQNRSILLNGGMMLLIALLSAVAAVGVGFLGSRTSAGFGRDLRRRVFEQVLSFGQQEMDEFSTASLITRSTNDIQQVQNVMVMLLRTIIYAPIMGIGGIIRALRTNASMSWVIALGVAVVMLIVLVLYFFAMPRFKQMQTQVDGVNRVLRETLTGLPVIRAFCTQQREEERFDAASNALKKTHLFVGRLMGGMMPMMMLTMNGISVLIMWLGAGSINTGTMQVGDMMAFIQYTMQIISAFLMISMMSVMLPRASVAAGRIHEVLSVAPCVTDPETPAEPDAAKAGEVEFRNVSFRYPGADEDTLSGISFVARPGETTAVLGGTGSGKSTLINLIPRFYDATAGTVLVGGEDVRKLRLTQLRDRIGMVPQKAVLFTGTVHENLTFGSEGIPEETVRKAAQIACAEEFVLDRDGGYNSELAQGGSNVSGGQKQRLSIARAVAKQPDIYIFDDSFSALDFKTEAAVRSALRDATDNATMIVVAQRISTVMHAEQILVLEDGRLAGKGTHRQLMESCEVYRQIAMSQLSKEELEDAAQR